MAADNSVLPILGYSTDGHFDAEDIPSNMAAWLATYRDAVSDIAAGANERAYPTMEGAWQQLLDAEPVAASREVVVGPLLSTTWSQSPYYNNLCPGTGSNKAVTGCVATAMGQIMRYWQWPLQGHGHHSYVANYAQYGYADYGTQYADFGSATYNYNAMPNALTSNSSSIQVGQIAQLLYHCGVSVNMMYGPNASGANSENVPAAMQNYFGYKSSTFQYKNGESAWVNGLKAQLNADRPVCIKGHFHLDSDSITFRLESVVYYTDWSVERKAFNNVDLSEIIYWGNSIDSNRLARDMSPRSQIVWEVDSSHNVYGKQQYRPTTCNYWGLSSQQRTEKKINPPREYRAAFSYDDQNSGYLIIDGKKRAIRRITIDGEEFYYIFPQIE